MGYLVYENSIRKNMDDRLLTHIQIVISTKLRRGESFLFTWAEDADAGFGRTAIWLHPHCSLVFRFHGSRVASINPAWVDALAYQANSPGGLFAIPEPEATSTSAS